MAQKSPEKPQDTFERYNVQSNSKGRDRENNLQRIFSTIFSLEKDKVVKYLNSEHIFPDPLPQRFALVINNKDFINDAEAIRKGSDVDLKSLNSLFSEELQFQVTERSNLTYQEMMMEVRSFASKEEHGEADMAAVVVMSHGREGVVCTTDHRMVQIDWILKQFNNDECPRLRGKPKLFVFQACRGDDSDYGVSTTASDSQRSSGGMEMKENSWSDMVIAYSTIPGYVANRDIVDGSWFIQSFCQVFRERAKTLEIREMLDLVSKRLREFQSERGTKQSFDYVVRHLYKKFYFFSL